MTYDDFLLRDWRNLFHPNRAFMLGWLTPEQRATLEARMLQDYDATIANLVGTNQGASPALTKCRTAIAAQATATKVKRQTATVQQRRKWIEQAFCGHVAYDVWERIRDCGTDRMRCGSRYCTKCFNRYVDSQTTLMRQLFANHATEADQRANIRQLTVLFDAFPFDLHSKAYPTICAQRSDKARAYARKEIQALKRRFPAITIVGAFEMEPIDGPTKESRRDSSALDTLLRVGMARHTGHGIYRTHVPSSMQQWANHLILYHGHFVVDLNGTDDKDFRVWCHSRWGNKRRNDPVRRGVHVQNLYTTRTIEQSLQTLARYPLKTPFHYHVPKNNCGQPSTGLIRYEDTILSAMVVDDDRIGICGVKVQKGMRQ